MRTVFKISHEKLWELGLNYFIVTHGERGSVLHTRDGIAEIMPQKAKKVVDPTGAGDAFRAGLIHGLLSGKSIPESMKIGARLGVRCVEKKGGQTYRI